MPTPQVIPLPTGIRPVSAPPEAPPMAEFSDVQLQRLQRSYRLARRDVLPGRPARTLAACLETVEDELARRRDQQLSEAGTAA